VLADGTETRVRLLGVDAPEPGRPYAAEAQRFLTNLLIGESVWLDSDQPDEKDLFSRRLAYVYRSPDGLFVNLEILRQGYGAVYTKATCRQSALFTEHETRAKQARKGLWGPDATPPGPAPAPPPPVVAQPKPPPKIAPAAPQKPDEENVTVYTTRTGSKYHRAGCSYLRKSSIPISLKDAKARGLGPCSRCDPPR
jgi:hypothetical protein